MSTVAHCPMPEAWPLLPSSLQKALDPHLDVLTTSSCVQLDSDSPVSQEYDVPEDGSVAWLPTVQFPCYLLFKYYQQILQQYVTRIKNSVKLAMLWKVRKFMYTMYTITDLKTTKRQACRYHNTLPPIRPLTCIQKKNQRQPRYVSNLRTPASIIIEVSCWQTYGQTDTTWTHWVEQGSCRLTLAPPGEWVLNCSSAKWSNAYLWISAFYVVQEVIRYLC